MTDFGELSVIFDRSVDVQPSPGAIVTLRVLLGISVAITLVAWLAFPAKSLDTFVSLAVPVLYGIALAATFAPQTGAALSGGIALIFLIVVAPPAALLTWIGIGLHDVKKNDIPAMLAFWGFFATQIAIVIAAMRVRRGAKRAGILWLAGGFVAFVVLLFVWNAG